MNNAIFDALEVGQTIVIDRQRPCNNRYFLATVTKLTKTQIEAKIEGQEGLHRYSRNSGKEIGKSDEYHQPEIAVHYHPQYRLMTAQDVQEHKDQLAAEKRRQALVNTIKGANLNHFSVGQLEAIASLMGLKEAFYENFQG